MYQINLDVSSLFAGRVLSHFPVSLRTSIHSSQAVSHHWGSWSALFQNSSPAIRLPLSSPSNLVHSAEPLLRHLLFLPGELLPTPHPPCPAFPQVKHSPAGWQLQPQNWHSVTADTEDTHTRTESFHQHPQGALPMKLWKMEAVN